MSIMPTRPSFIAEVRKLIERNVANGDWGEPTLPGREFVPIEDAHLIDKEADQTEDS